MGDSLWSAFTETGEPMCYLLCKAEEKAGTSSRSGKENTKAGAESASARKGKNKKPGETGGMSATV
ncbi:MAG: hypothetical protein ACI4PC_09425 [Oscillospiraceae bacterium]